MKRTSFGHGFGRLIGLLCLILGVSVTKAQASCTPVDFMTLDLSQRAPDAPPTLRALHIAYPSLLFSAAQDAVTTDGTRWVALGTIRQGISPRDRLRAPTVMEHFTYPYPLTFDLGPRRTAYHDPGRLRHDPFFELLYFTTEDAARQSLTRVPFNGFSNATVQVTTAQGVDCQLRAVLAALHPHAPQLSRFFVQPGGGFNWRQISGTTRRSAHSYGIAVDINPALGGYWRWSGAKEGRAANFKPQIPEILVSTFERYGFIWGGKWHHFDGMHFEYRPELIIHARLLSQPTDS